MIMTANDWETLYFGGAANAHPNATAANGINTIYETYVAGLNPTNAQSVFSVSNVWKAAEQLAQQRMAKNTKAPR